MYCRVPWGAGAIVDPSSKGLVFLPSPHQFTFPHGPKKISCVKCTVVGYEVVWWAVKGALVLQGVRRPCVNGVEVRVRRDKTLQLSADFSAEACKSP